MKTDLEKFKEIVEMLIGKHTNKTQFSIEPKRKRGRPSNAEVAARKKAEQKDLALIICMYVGLFMVIAFCVNLALASEMTFKFKSPSFSGVNTSQHYLTIENQEHTRYKTIQEELEALVEQAERDEQNTTTARFIRNFETRVYAKLSQQLVEKLFGERYANFARPIII